MQFVRKTFFLLIMLLLLCQSALAADFSKLVILHTNDTHSQIEPIAPGKRDGNHAGYARRMGLIEQERKAHPALILVDAGDFCQGTPYFNFYHGRMEVDALNKMGYDAITLGNHEFDFHLSRLEELIAQSQAGDNQATEALVEENSGLIWAIVRRFLGRGAEADDLYQLGCLGFLKAVKGFDLQFGTQFSTYAVPKISGEIRRFLRLYQIMPVLLPRQELLQAGRDMMCF